MLFALIIVGMFIVGFCSGFMFTGYDSDFYRLVVTVIAGPALGFVLHRLIPVKKKVEVTPSLFSRVMTAIRRIDSDWYVSAATGFIASTILAQALNQTPVKKPPLDPSKKYDFSAFDPDAYLKERGIETRAEREASFRWWTKAFVMVVGGYCFTVFLHAVLPKNPEPK